MALSYQLSVSIPSGVMRRRLGDESVILELDSAHYFGLDEVGTRMLDLLDRSATIQEAYDALLEEYEVEPDELAREFEQLIDKLLARKLIATEAP